MDNLNRFARVPCGFAAMKDVRTGSHEDRWEDKDFFLRSVDWPSYCSHNPNFDIIYCAQVDNATLAQMTIDCI